MTPSRDGAPAGFGGILGLYGAWVRSPAILPSACLRFDALEEGRGRVSGADLAVVDRGRHSPLQAFAFPLAVCFVRPLQAVLASPVESLQ